MHVILKEARLKNLFAESQINILTDQLAFKIKEKQELIKTILNKCHKFKSFVYNNACLVEMGNREVVEVDIISEKEFEADILMRIFQLRVSGVGNE